MKRILLIKLFALILSALLIFLLLQPSLRFLSPAFNVKSEEAPTDFGDAPEGAPAYPSLGIIGRFPTCKLVGPAAFIMHGLGWGRFGLWDSEPDGNGGICAFPIYDRDECFKDQDAGLMFPEPFTINQNMTIVPCGNSKGTSLGPPCTIAVWGQNIDIQVTNNMPCIAMVNILFDWNQDGMWGGSLTCPSGVAPEHVLVNFPIPMGYSGPLSKLFPPSFLIGPNSGYFWARFTISELAVPPNWDGSGGFEDGETEDYLIYVQPTATLTLEVEPSNCALHQDETAIIKATLKNHLGVPISGNLIKFAINPAAQGNVRNIGWINPSPPNWPPNSTLNFGITDANGVVRMCLGTRNVENILVTATTLVGGVNLSQNVVVAFAQRPLEAKATSFTSNGDYISNWYWLRDAQYANYGEWTFTGIKNCPNYILLRGEHLVTNTVNGGSGYSTWVTYQFLNPLTNDVLGTHSVFLLNLWQLGPLQNYNTISSICVPSSYVKNGMLKVRIYRFNPNQEHVAVNKDSLILKTCEICQYGGIKGSVTAACSGAKIEIKDKQTGNIAWSGTADKSGNFDTCFNLKPGSYTVVPTYQGCTFSPASIDVDVKLCEKAYVSFQCNCELGGIIGKVLDSHIQGSPGKPCPNIKVTISGPNPLTVVAWSGTTNENGIFDTCFNLRAGEYTVSISSTCEPPTKVVKVEPGKKTEETFLCLCLGGISGKIICENKTPCAGIVVSIYNNSGVKVWSGTTDSTGWYDTCYTLPPGSYTVKATSQLCSVTPSQQVITVLACSKKTVDFKCDCCTKLGGIEGKVTDPTSDAGCANVTVVALGPAPSTEIAWWGKTDASGKYTTCLTLKPGEYTVYAKLPCEKNNQKAVVVAGTHTVVDFSCNCAASKVILWLNPSVEEVKNEKGAIFKKTVEIGKPSETVSDLMLAKFSIKFDPTLISVKEVYEGNFLKQGGASTTFSYELHNDSGIATLSITRAGSTGANGYGTLGIVVFEVVGSPLDGDTTEVLLPEEYSLLFNKSGALIPHYNKNEEIIFKEKPVIIGDFDQDGKIENDDASLFKLAYGKKSGDNGWDTEDSSIPGSPFKRFDLWDSSLTITPPITVPLPDGIVDFNDLMALVMNWNFYNLKELPVETQPTGKAKASFNPRSSTLEKDKNVKLDFLLSNLNKDLTAAHIKIAFDSPVISCTGVSEGELLKTGGNFTLFFYKIEGNTIEIVTARFGTPSSLSSGILANLNFKTLSYGISSIRASDIDLRNWKNEKIQCDSAEASVEVKREQIVIRLYIDKTTYYVNDELKTMDVAPIIRESRTLLPIRYVAEALGADVQWDPAERKVTITFKGTIIELWIDKNSAKVNGVSKFIDPANPKVVPIIIPPGRTMLPIRFIAESLGCLVEWNAALREVKVTYPAP